MKVTAKDLSAAVKRITDDLAGMGVDMEDAIAVIGVVAGVMINQSGDEDKARADLNHHIDGIIRLGVGREKESDR